MSDGLDVRLLPVQASSRWRAIPAWLYPLPVLSLALIIAGVIIIRRDRRPKPVPRIEVPRSEPQPRTPEPPPTRPIAPVTFRAPAPVVVPPTGPVWVDQPLALEPVSARLHLAVISGPGSALSRDVELRKVSVIGRSPTEADVSFPGDSTMSGRHFELRFEDGVVIVRDLGSSNGTSVNGVTIRPTHKLADGDVVTAGQTQLRIFFQEHAGPRGGKRAPTFPERVE